MHPILYINFTKIEAPLTIYSDTKLANINLFKFSNRNTRKTCEICSKFTIKTLEQRH